MLVQSKLKKQVDLEEKGSKESCSVYQLGEKEDEIHRFYRFEGHGRSILASNDEDQCPEEFLKST